MTVVDIPRIPRHGLVQSSRRIKDFRTPPWIEPYEPQFDIVWRPYRESINTLFVFRYSFLKLEGPSSSDIPLFTSHDSCKLLSFFVLMPPFICISAMSVCLKSSCSLLRVSCWITRLLASSIRPMDDNQVSAWGFAEFRDLLLFYYFIFCW